MIRARGRRAILIGAAPCREADLKALLARLGPATRDLKIGVDGGLRSWLRLGFEPDFSVGDWDSLRDRRLLRDHAHLSLSERKDRSDLHYACRAAARFGATELVCLGVTGGRPDHHLAALFDLAEAGGRLQGVSGARALGPEAEYVFLSPRGPLWRRRVERGQLLSVFALGGRARGVTLSGLEYPLRGGIVVPSSLGLSNRSKGGMVTVRLRQGRLVVVLPTS